MVTVVKCISFFQNLRRLETRYQLQTPSSIISWSVLLLQDFWQYETQHNDIQYKDIQHKGLFVTLNINDIKILRHSA